MFELKPFLKWAGGKFRIVERIKEKLLPGKRLIEPFVGSGAVFLNTDYPEYLLSDINKDLINLYIVLQTEGREFIKYCKSFFSPGYNNEDKYYHLRSEFNKTADIYYKSALFLYLNKHGYNGLIRYNSSGGFNVPFGSHEKPYFPENELLYFWEKSQKAVFKNQDFTLTMQEAQPGDVVYCDPPYAPLSETANFTSYSAGGFTSSHQLKLAEMAEKLADNGIPVLLSNHNIEFIRKAYASADITSFEVRRFISCDGANRNKAGEVLALFAGRN